MGDKIARNVIKEIEKLLTGFEISTAKRNHGSLPLGHGVVKQPLASDAALSLPKYGCPEIVSCD